MVALGRWVAVHVHPRRRAGGLNLMAAWVFAVWGCHAYGHVRPLQCSCTYGPCPGGHGGPQPAAGGGVDSRRLRSSPVMRQKQQGQQEQEGQQQGREQGQGAEGKGGSKRAGAQGWNPWRLSV